MNKYTKKGFDYDAAWAQSDKAKVDVAASLNVLASILEKRNGDTGKRLTINGGSSYDMDDVVYLPDIRKLTCVKGIAWPDTVRRYVDDACADAGVELYDSWSC